MSRVSLFFYSLFAILVLGISAFLYGSSPTPRFSEVLGEVTITTTTAPTIEETSGTVLATPTEGIPTDTEFDPSTPMPSSAASAPIATSAPTNTPMVTLSFQTPTLLETKSGSITKYVYTSLAANTLYRIVLPETTADTMVISWPSITTTIRWAAGDSITQADLTPLPIDDEGDERTGFETVLHSGLLSVPKSRSIYVYVPVALDSLTVSLILPAPDASVFSTQTVGVYNSDAGAGYSAHGLMSRDQWGANPGSWDSNSSANVNAESRLIWYPVYYRTARIVVHHTATTPNYSTPAAAVRAIYLYHSYIRGWGDIGYNFLIDQNGTVYQGKLGGDGTMGYHAFGAANKISLSISLIGDFSYSSPPAAQRDSLIRQLAEKSAFHGFTLKYGDGSQAKWRDPSYTLFGHRTSFQWNSGSNSWSILSTACPGNDLVGLLPSLAASAESYKATHYSDLKQVVTDVNQSFTAPHQEGVIVIKYNVPTSTAPEVIASYLPKFSGITSYTIDGNTVTIPITSSIVTHPDTSTEYLIPPMNWMGYDDDTPEFSTFTPAFVINGPEERAKVLLKIFKLDSRVLAADLIHTYSVDD